MSPTRLVIVLAVTVGVTQPQTIAPQAPPKFEVASIKPCRSDSVGNSRGEGRGPRLSPGRFRLQCLTVAEMIREAYVENAEDKSVNFVRSEQLDKLARKGPSWIRSDWYTIDAKPEGTPAKNVMLGPMLRALLEDRFKLKVHRERGSGIRADGCKKRPKAESVARRGLQSDRFHKTYFSTHSRSEALV